MNDIKELAAAIYRDRVQRAREQEPAEKLLDGPRLFDYACWISMAGIRSRFPDADEKRVLEILVEQIELARRLENSR